MELLFSFLFVSFPSVFSHLSPRPNPSPRPSIVGQAGTELDALNEHLQGQRVVLAEKTKTVKELLDDIREKNEKVAFQHKSVEAKERQLAQYQEQIKVDRARAEEELERAQVRGALPCLAFGGLAEVSVGWLLAVLAEWLLAVSAGWLLAVSVGLRCAMPSICVAVWWFICIATPPYFPSATLSPTAPQPAFSRTTQPVLEEARLAVENMDLREVAALRTMARPVEAVQKVCIMVLALMGGINLATDLTYRQARPGFACARVVCVCVCVCVCVRARACESEEFSTPPPATLFSVLLPSL